MSFQFDNTYARHLPGFYAPGQPAQAPAPKLIKLNTQLASELQLDIPQESAAQIFSGNTPPEGAQVIAQAYAGHQFGHFVPQLGDGRALLYGEVIDANGRRRDIQLKGSGRTAFSRGGDGKAALGPVLREYLMGEGMHALGIPTTRALAAVATGEPVYRERPLPGAVLTRIAASHIRVGTFQFFAAHASTDKVRLLAEYSIARHYPQATNALELLTAVRDAQAALIAKWMLVGFIHGVMNTDNMAISGETIDYGPCAFMDTYSPKTVFSSIDQNGRYAYGQQPSIAVWNLSRLAETLLPLIHDDEKTAVDIATDVLRRFMPVYETHWLNGMRAKLGITVPDDSDRQLITDFLQILEAQKLDFAQSFRRLSTGQTPDANWAKRWQPRRTATPAEMDAVNPLYIPRNHKVEEALKSAEANNFEPFETLNEVLKDPFTERPGLEAYAAPNPSPNPAYRTFCGT